MKNNNWHKDDLRVNWNGQAVVSLPMVDRAHKLPEGNARRNFNRNKNRFIPRGTICPAQRGHCPGQKAAAERT
ncbi:MAG: ORF6N domain-containing protein [Nitrospirae bacterium]|nr:ORF6N domain-containing protein [Nitrospirota bacterium]